MLGAILYSFNVGTSEIDTSTSTAESTLSTVTDEPIVEAEKSDSNNANVETKPSETPKPPSNIPINTLPSIPPTGTQTPAEPVAEPQTPEVATPTTWTPGFLASSRVTPEIPSENERALLPSCDSMKFTNDFIQTSNVQLISQTSSGGEGGIVDRLTFDFGTRDASLVYNVTAPGDVYITHIKTEYGVSPDSTDTTIYFALCRDVFGYFTNIKELSLDSTEILNESPCATKPHTGLNACLPVFLKQIGKGSSLGKVGGLGGTFSFGVFDVRTQRVLSNPASYSIATNFSHCPFEYLSANGMLAKLQSGLLCSSQ